MEEESITPEALQERLKLMEEGIAALRARAQKYEGFRQEFENLRQKYADDLFEERKQVTYWHEQALRWQQEIGRAHV